MKAIRLIKRVSIMVISIIMFIGVNVNAEMLTDEQAREIFEGIAPNITIIISIFTGIAALAALVIAIVDNVINTDDQDEKRHIIMKTVFRILVSGALGGVVVIIVRNLFF